jgi:hypothetical protein
MYLGLSDATTREPVSAGHRSLESDGKRRIQHRWRGA